MFNASVRRQLWNALSKDAESRAVLKVWAQAKENPEMAYQQMERLRLRVIAAARLYCK